MSQEFQQHWLSAYLDNELSSDERALVERRLEEDVQARQLLEDLKRVRGLVATLPAWPGSNFQFDMSRLSDDTLADDDGLDEVAVKTVEAGAAKQSAGMSTAAWRGVLSLAAGLLLLILCVPLFRQRDAGTFAIGTRSAVPESKFAPGGGVMPGTGSAVGPDTTSEMVDADAKGLADAPFPSPPAAPFTAPADPGARGGAPGASPAPGPSRASAPVASAAGGLGARAGLERFEKSAQSPDNQPGSQSSQRFVCAKSDAWSEVEVKQSLPELLKYVSEQPSSVELQDEAEQKAKLSGKESSAAKTGNTQAENSFGMVPDILSKNELMFSELPKTADVNSWFVQIQTAQPLTQLQLTPELRLKEVDVQEVGKLAEATEPSSLGGAVAPAASIPMPKADTSRAEPKAESSEKSLQFEALPAKKEATLQGRIILFVTEAEARKIMASLFPTKPRGAAEPNDDDKKVIVILKR